jgi:ADP-ribosylglycohydrolase
MPTNASFSARRKKNMAAFRILEHSHGKMHWKLTKIHAEKSLLSQCWYQLKNLPGTPHIGLTRNEVEKLSFCRDLLQRLLPVEAGKKEEKMLGAIIGDIIGSVYEFDNLKTDDLDAIELMRPDSRYTDDTVLTFAVAEAVMADRDYGGSLRKWGRGYPRAGYGGRFYDWLLSDNPQPYNSWGNGSAMRVSPVAWAFSDLDSVLREAARSAEPTHNHPEGIRGAQATAAAVWLARKGAGKDDIRAFIIERFLYDLSRSVAEIRPEYVFNESCQGTVPEALAVFLESRDFEHAMKLAVSIGGDSDTIACITGGIAEAFYGEIPCELSSFAWDRLTEPMREIFERFMTQNDS